ncbi:MAG: carbohydrate-binding protein [Elusimicrobia bacterium]|nr:carbohydrate-binding protein [Elusimicrobiota bacterium]
MKRHKLFLGVYIFILLGVLYGTANAAMRGRPRIVDNNVVAENGWPLRGDTARVGDWVNSTRDFWKGMRDQFNYNCARIFVYRDMRALYGVGTEGQAWLTIDECIVELDKQVQWAEELGMYVLIEYSACPNGAYIYKEEPWKSDVLAFWDKVAPRYANKTHVMYALAGEPGGYLPENFLSDSEAGIRWQEMMYQRVRALAPNTPLSMWEFAGPYRADPAICMTQIVKKSVGIINYSNAFVGYHLYGVIESELKELKDNYPQMPTGGCYLGSTDDTLDAKINMCLRNGVTSWILLNGVKPLELSNVAVTVRWSKDPLAVDGPTTPDTTAPTITILSPLNNSTVAASLLTVSGTALDNIGLNKVELKVGAGGTYTAVGVTLSPWSGSVTLASGSNIVYAKATDISNNWKESTITVTYTPGSNNPPVANSQGVSVTKDTPKSITLTATDADGNSLTYSIVTQPGHGTLTGTAPNVTYTPASGYTGTDSFTFKANDGKADSNVATVSITISAPVVQSPFGGTARSIPGTIQAEDFDNGGEGIAYHDTTLGQADPNNTYRATESVDLETCSDSGGGYDVGYVVTGEWLEYTVNVNTAGTYTIESQVACGGEGGNFHIEIDNVDKTGAMTVPNTGGWNIWQTVTKTGVNLSAGQHIMKLAMDTIGTSGATGNFNYIQFTKVVDNTDTTPPAISIISPANNTTVPTSLLTLSGTATDNVGLSEVELKVGLGGTYAAVSGTLSPWSGSVTLVSGSNVVYARATDTSNNVKETTITVTYTPAITLSKISGNVQLYKSGSGVSGITMNLSGKANSSCITGAEGNYEFVGLESGNYVVEPVSPNWRFWPNKMEYTGLSSDKAEQNFIGKPFSVTRTVSSKVQISSGMAVTPISESSSIESEISVLVPKGAFSTTANLTLTAIDVPVSDRTMNVVGYGVDIINDKNLQPVKELTITINYDDSGIVGYNENKLVVGYYDESNKRWVALPTTVYASSNKVVGKSTHLSKFALLELVSATNLINVKIYPVPYNPAKHVQGLKIEGITAGAVAKIYTVGGELLKELVESGNSGSIVWDGKNEGGKEVASGIYILYIEGTTGVKKVKIVVER